MSNILRNQKYEESTHSTYSLSSCHHSSKKLNRKSYTKRPLKNGEWDRNEVIKFFTCNTMYFKYGITWKHLIKFICTRTVQQVYNKIKISQDAIKYVNINFWKEHSISDFLEVNEKDYFTLFSQIQKKISIFLSQNSKNIFHTKKQKLNAIPKIQMHHFCFSETENENYCYPDELERSAMNLEKKPMLIQMVRNISIEMGNEDFSTFLNLKQYESPEENLIKIDYKSLIQFLVKKNEN